MQSSFKNKPILHKLCFLSLLIGAVEMQKNDFKCSVYKRLVFEETHTFSYFLPGSKEISYTEDHCSTFRGFVVGGENAEPKEFAFAARLGHATDNGDVKWFCGGTLISESIVLTAAHCFYASQGEVNRVRLGELDFDTDTDDAKPEDFDVDELIEHPDYNYGEHYNDIGLLKLSSTVKFDRYKHPACLPISSSLRNLTDLIAIGWGHTMFWGRSSSHLQKVGLRSYSYTMCQRLAEGPEGKERLSSGLKRSQLCAGSTEEKDTCQGDSGGPLLVLHKKYPCMFSVVGITSFGVGGCAIPNVPAIYTNVNFYLDWISEYVK